MDLTRFSGQKQEDSYTCLGAEWGGLWLLENLKQSRRETVGASQQVKIKQHLAVAGCQQDNTGSVPPSFTPFHLPPSFVPLSLWIGRNAGQEPCQDLSLDLTDA